MKTPLKKTCLFLFSILLSTHAFAMSVDFDFKRKHQCSAESPELRVSDIPAGTTELSVTMIDHDMRSFDHGGGSILNPAGFTPSTIIPEGALKSYKGPCPPNFSSFGHDYEFVVKARSKDGEVAKAGTKRTFSSEKVKE